MSDSKKGFATSSQKLPQGAMSSHNPQQFATSCETADWLACQVNICCLSEINISMVGYGMVWYILVCYGMLWYGMVWYGVVWYDLVWCGMVWYGMDWYGRVWYGMDIV